MAKGSRQRKKPPTEIRAETIATLGEPIPEEALESHVQRHRPDGPAPHPKPSNIHVDIAGNFRWDLVTSEDNKRTDFVITFAEEPRLQRVIKAYKTLQKAKLEAAKFTNIPRTHKWTIPASPEAHDIAQKLVADFSGKTERYGVFAR